MTVFDLIIVGAGPYGLACAAQAKKERLNYLLVGAPMKFWYESMPGFMQLRSPFVASSIYGADDNLSLKAFYDETGRSHTRTTRIPVKVYLQYVEWYVKNAGLNIRSEEVVSLVKSDAENFQVKTTSGECLQSKTVIVATGNPPFATVPDVVRDIDKKFISHTRDVPDFTPFANRRVLVVGAGQSAIEACLGLLQSGASVELSHRQKELYWHDIPLRINVPVLLFFITIPTVLEIVPYAIRKAVGDFVSRPTVDKWLKEKIQGKVKEYCETDLLNVEETSEGVKVIFTDGRETLVDHIILGTGYAVDIKKLDFLDGQIKNFLGVRDGYPLLSRHLESNLQGLFFNGLPAKGRFGPPFNFIFASPAGAKRVIKGVQSRLSALDF